MKGGHISRKDADSQDTDTQQDGKEDDDPPFIFPEKEEGRCENKQAPDDHRCIEDLCRGLVDEAVRGAGRTEVTDLAGGRAVPGRVKYLCGDDSHQDHRTGQEEEQPGQVRGLQYPVSCKFHGTCQRYLSHGIIYTLRRNQARSFSPHTPCL